MKAIRIHQTGGPESLVLEDVPKPSAAGSDVLVRIEVAGVNYIDTYHRSGLYPVATPFTPGVEGAGVVEAAGPEARRFVPGDRVAYASAMGSYAEFALAAEDRLVRVPPGVDSRSAAAAILQGMTAHYLAIDTFRLRPGHVALAHAGAGGVGLLLIQVAKRLGATVIATVSTPAKADLARGAGADHVILYTQADFLAETRRLTGGAGVDVVYDAVGKDTFQKSIDCLKPRGYMVLYGAASGPVTSFDPGVLSAKGSLFLTRPSLGNYVATRDELERRSGDVFSWIQDGSLKLRMVHDFPLAQAAEAHRMLQARQTTGKVLLIP